MKTLVVTYKTVLKSIHELIEIGMHKMKSRDDHTKAHELFAEAFNVPRESRSHEYKSGVLAALLYRFEGIKIMNNCPYGEGTAELDAFLSGCDEGHRIWRAYTERQSAVPHNQQ